MKWAIITLVAAGGLQGCFSVAPGTASLGTRGWLDTQTGGMCFNLHCDLNSGLSVSPTAVRIRVTNNPSDEEVWITEYRVPVRAAVGIPYGRMPIDRGYLTEEQCERARSVNASTPSESCRPIHIRRESTGPAPAPTPQPR